VIHHTKPATNAIQTDRADRRRIDVEAMKSVEGLVLESG